MHCYDPDGDLIGKILVPEVVANVMLRRPATQPALHLRHDLAVLVLHAGARREDVLNSLRHREERRDAATQAVGEGQNLALCPAPGLLRCARKDGLPQHGEGLREEVRRPEIARLQRERVGLAVGGEGPRHAGVDFRADLQH